MSSPLKVKPPPESGKINGYTIAVIHKIIPVIASAIAHLMAQFFL